MAAHATQDHHTGWQQQQQQQPTEQPMQAHYQQPQHNYIFGTHQQQPPFVQPHINPRFASQFGVNFGYAQPPYYPQNVQYPHQDLNTGDSNWTDEWTVYGGGGDSSGAGDNRTI